MTKLDRYVLAEAGKPLLLALVVVLAALLMERLLRILDLVANQGGPLLLALRLIASLVPHYLGLALPAAFFLAVFLVISKFAQHSELDAIQGAGVSLARLLRPLIVLGALLAVASLLLYGYIQPHARYASKVIQYVIANSAWDTMLQEGVFIEEGGKLTLLAEDIDQADGTLGGVFVNRELGGGRSLATTARTAELLRSPDGRRVLLRLHDGVQISAGPEIDDVGVMSFGSFDVDVALDGEIPPFRARGRGERELTLVELWHRRGDAGTLGPAIRAELHARLARALSLALLPFVAAPFGVAAKRTRQTAGLTVAAMVLLLYDHALLFGASLAELERIPAPLGSWVPFAAFATLGAVLFRRVLRRPDNNPVDAVLDALEATARTLARLRRSPTA
ncbi:MAG: YjgP/YjgQ family permease [Alphaproteobacteria bacterium]|nr:YjgP/YjgQ family permease [Alphaproteobacteria bacterium]